MRRTGDRLYVVAYQKSPEHIGAFFTESNLAGVERALPDVEVSISVPGKVLRAGEPMTGQRPRADGCKVCVTLPATHYRVVEVEVDK